MSAKRESKSQAKAKESTAKAEGKRKSPSKAAASGKKATALASSSNQPVASVGATALRPRMLDKPVFAQPQPTADPTVFRVPHPSDDAAYKEIDKLNAEHKLFPLPFPAPRGGVEPQLTLAEVMCGNATAIDRITAAGQLVFHALGDCGNTKGPATQNEVADKLTADFNEANASEVPQFALLLGDVVYSFGESQYYYDQFYEPYRDYPAPILACAGNHDGMVSPEAHAASLTAFLRNFCAETFAVTPEAGGLSRTAQIQPGVFFTLEAPFVRVLVIYSNTLEDPGVISDPKIGSTQLDFLDAALKRVKAEQFTGALLIADHHPPYSAGGHGSSVDMLAQIDKVCEANGVWPHAFLSGHAHNYQRFTRTRNADGTQIPYLVCGNGGHGLVKLAAQGAPAIRAPQIMQAASATTDQVVLENYDDTNYGYLRVVVTATQLRIEYHSASDGLNTKAPNDYVTINLAERKVAHFVASDLGRPMAARAVRALLRR
ncbi:3',5'-cyclic adenosine monophosphate phosphodiesterase CpdA [Paraburkholderia aspalathi]|uniref:metallophosphoesterase family protein n=1 Tax=Paraburkholderia aspalathi TaxID=1324617 RepID=UPI001909BE69|nr:metallophosphoesterase [Paraburkholderia aspalathi]MBK3840531.1 metallophosphoesterase [Paraburkholderia aspalathi]CAE6785039.1 3',5'-cyclic adenosine monophosphate phosphodiesterase CpdA [Paraburkholderia aspalathi]